MLSDITRVASTGPPCVITHCGTNTCKPVIMLITLTKSSVGLSNGMVMWRKTCQPLDPSTFAASYKSDGMLCNPARKTTMKKPTSFQTLMMTCLLYTSDAADEEDSVDLGGR